MDVIYNTSIYFAVQNMATRTPGSLVNAMVSLVAVCLAESWGSVSKMKREWILESNQRCLTHILTRIYLNAITIASK